MTDPKRIAKGLYWDRAWYLVQGCTPVSEGCANCWAAREAHMRAHQKNEKIRTRYEGLTMPEGKWNGQIRLLTENLKLPLRVKKTTVWAVWNDLFHEKVSIEFIFKALRIMRDCERHTFLILTKRPKEMKQAIEYYQTLHPEFWPVNNCWLGVTAENQKAANERIPILLQIPAAVRFVSVEPMLGAIKMRFGWLGHGPGTELQRDQQGWLGGINWIICGGETGPGARPMHPAWVRSLRDQCQTSGTPFFFKSWGEWITEPNFTSANWRWLYSHQSHTFENGVVAYRVGKKAAGRILDGRTWDEMPK